MMSRPPNVSIAAPTKRSENPASETLPLTAIASPPPDRISAATASPGAASRSLTPSFAPSLASFIAIARPMPRPDPVISATFPLSFAICLLSGSECDDGFAGELDLTGLIPGGERQSRALLAGVLKQFGDRALAGQPRAKLCDCDKARRERADAWGRDRIGQGLAEIGHDQHAVREDIRESGLFCKIQIDMDRIVVARGAA